MSNHIYLALAIHNHQPVGNFEWVFQEAYRKAYAPMVTALEAHPSVRLALHYSGSLRDWLLEKQPALLKRIRALVERGQVEIMTGGYYEPILVAWPDVDKLGQIEKLTQAIRDDFGCKPKGAWLSERVWEPHLPKPLCQAGIEYTIVDDTHFKYVGYADDDLFGYYLTEEQGYTLKIFPTSKHLRYTIPWAPVEEVMAWLRSQASPNGAKVAIMGDDGEKFGLWPGTYKHCWEEGWIEEFFAQLEANSDWLTPIPPGEYAARFEPLGRIYLPTAAYDEMTEWALPAEASGELVALKHRLQEEGREEVLHFLRGGFWRHFMVKYQEVNQMHKKALWVSENVHGMAEGQAKREALDHVWAAQGNCAYWHGVFGGIYLFHIRGANYYHLIQAERLADAQRKGSAPWVETAVVDFDLDGRDEIVLTSEEQSLVLKPSQGGCLVEWDHRPLALNLLNTMTRRPEGYHRPLKEAAERGDIVVMGQSERNLETIHTVAVRVKEPGLEEKLFYDWYRRGALIDHFLHPDTELEHFYRVRYGELGDFVDQPYRYSISQSSDRVTATLRREGQVWQGEIAVPVDVEKEIDLTAGQACLRVRYRIMNESDDPLIALFGVENNWGLEVGSDSCFLALEPEGSRHSLAALGSGEGIAKLTVASQPLGVEIGLSFERPANLWHFPIETISMSEGGYERSYQGTCTLAWWPLALEPGEKWEAGLTFTIAASKRAEESDLREG